MKLFYIDESGDTSTFVQAGRKFFVLCGCVIDDINFIEIESQLRYIKNKYWNNPDIEIKSNFLRYANPDLNEFSPLKLKLRDKYNELEDTVTAFLQRIPTSTLAVVIDKTAFWQQFPAGDPYLEAYGRLLKLFQQELDKTNDLGLCIIDPREGQVEKHYFGNEINTLHECMRHDNTCTNIIEKLLFFQSDKTIGIQSADLYAYPIYHIYEYHKSPADYWRYNEITSLKLIRTDKPY